MTVVEYDLIQPPRDDTADCVGWKIALSAQFAF